MFSALIKSLRAEKGLTQTQLAKKVGVSAGNIGDWEIGRSKPGYVALAALSRFFEVSADYLLELTPEKTGDKDNEIHCLEEIKREQGLLCDGSPLEDEEADMVAMYRLLPDYKKEDAFDIIHLMYQKHIERKRESIYWTYAAAKEKRKATADLDGGSQGVLA